MKTHYLIILTIWVSLFTACAAPKENLAHQALTDFFSSLAKGDYEAAAALYGGSYETLVTDNPELDLDNLVGLWKNACTVNGFQCVNIRAITFNELTQKGEYIFTVEFENSDGSLFKLGACCGETSSTPPQFQFEYRVVESGDGAFLVLDLPVYVP